MDTTDTLARRLGTTTHVSGLLRKARQLGLTLPKDLRTLAVQRGCRHHGQGDEPVTDLALESEFSNEELAIALLDVALPYDPESIRCGAAMLSAAGSRPERLAALARQERSELPVRYVAEAGQRYEPSNPFWRELLLRLPLTAKAQARRAAASDPVCGNVWFYLRGQELVVEWLRPAIRRAIAA